MRGGRAGEKVAGSAAGEPGRAAHLSGLGSLWWAKGSTTHTLETCWGGGIRKGKSYRQGRTSFGTRESQGRNMTRGRGAPGGARESWGVASHF